MPAAEAAGVVRDERATYELAFHVLPTVAEGEVAGIVAELKERITALGATITDEEAAERIDLAYEVVKHLEGKNRKFTSAYFGWIRFQSDAEAIAAINELMDETATILRHLTVKLTKQEEAQPFRYHEAMREAGTMVTNYEEQEVTPAASKEAATETTESTSDEETATTKEAADDTPAATDDTTTTT